MNKRLILNIALFLLGFLSATAWFYLNTSDIVIPSAATQLNPPLATEQHLLPGNHQLDIENYQTIIDDKNNQISALKSQLVDLSGKTDKNDSGLKNESQLNQQNPADETQEQHLKKMSMTDFEESMKDSFVDRFKGIVLELSGTELEAMKKSFNSSTDKNDWSNQYETSIANFLTENDLNGDHFIQTLSCNTQMCRLEVNTNNDESWNSLYASMTQQPWYKTITVEESSDYPGNHIYYLPSINN